MPLAKTNPLYIEVFAYIGAGAVLAGLVVVLFAMKLNKLMNEHPHTVPQL